MPMLLDRIRRKSDRRIKYDHGFLQCEHVAQPSGYDDQKLCLRDDACDAKEAGQAQRLGRMAVSVLRRSVLR